jgi:hypothetical protein
VGPFAGQRGLEKNESRTNPDMDFMGFAETSNNVHSKATATHRIVRMAGKPLAEIRIESSGGLADGRFGTTRLFDIVTRLALVTINVVQRF